MPRFYIKTFGCQMNEHDSRKIGALLAARGFEATETMDAADLILFNTCTIRHKAQHKALSDIGRTAEIKAARPAVMVGVCGCVAQQEREALFDRFPHIDLLFGPDQIPRLPMLLDTLAAEHRQVAALDLVNTPAEYEFLDLAPWASPAAQAGTDAVTHAESPGATAFVTIMKGCDANCAYCIVPKVRGREVCRPADDIVREVQELAARGVKEVTLLGQTVNTYGSRRHASTIPFHALLDRLAAETGMTRLRFTSPHPKDVSDALAVAFRNNDTLCKHIHLPLQSGSDRVLRAMRRSYSRTQYLDKVAMLRAACPAIAITTDLIVGFPGETDADFADTLETVRAACFDGMFAFAYSPRPGTESALRMADDVPEAVKKDRLAQLLDLNAHLVRRKLATRVGTVQQVLVEGASKQGGGQWTGRTTHNTPVNFTSATVQAGDLVPITITRARGYSLEGEVVA